MYKRQVVARLHEGLCGGEELVVGEYDVGVAYAADVDEAVAAVDVGPVQPVLTADKVERDIDLPAAADGGDVVVGAVSVVSLTGVKVEVELLGGGIEGRSVAALVKGVIYFEVDEDGVGRCV